MQADAVVYVSDDDEAVRDSLRFLLNTAGLVAQTYESATSFLNHLPRVKAGCTSVTMQPALTRGRWFRKEVALSYVCATRPAVFKRNRSESRTASSSSLTYTTASACIVHIL